MIVRGPVRRLLPDWTARCNAANVPPLAPAPPPPAAAPPASGGCPMSATMAAKPGAMSLPGDGGATRAADGAAAAMGLPAGIGSIGVTCEQTCKHQHSYLAKCARVTWHRLSYRTGIVACVT